MRRLMSSQHLACFAHDMPAHKNIAAPAAATLLLQPGSSALCCPLLLCCTLLCSNQIEKKVEQAIKDADTTCKESDAAHCAAA